MRGRAGKIQFIWLGHGASASEGPGIQYEMSQIIPARIYHLCVVTEQAGVAFFSSSSPMVGTGAFSSWSYGICYGIVQGERETGSATAEGGEGNKSLHPAYP